VARIIYPQQCQPVEISKAFSNEASISPEDILISSPKKVGGLYSDSTSSFNFLLTLTNDELTSQKCILGIWLKLSIF